MNGHIAAGDSVDLAWQIRRLADDAVAYGQVCRNLAMARDQLLPAAAPKRVADVLRAQFSGWAGSMAQSKAPRSEPLEADH